MHRTVFLLALLLTSLVHAQTAPQSWGDAVNGLQMSIAHDENAKGPHSAVQFKLEFRNVAQGKLVITTSEGCGKRGREATSNIIIILVDSQGISHHLPFEGDGPPYQGGVCAGVVSIIQSTLDPGGSLSLPLDLGKFVDLSDSKSYVMARFPAGVYSLQVSLNMDKTSKVLSNTLQVRFDSEFAAPLSDFPSAH